jgi:hypothetical protein
MKNCPWCHGPAESKDLYEEGVAVAHASCVSMDCPGGEQWVRMDKWQMRPEPTATGEATVWLRAAQLVRCLTSQLPGFSGGCDEDGINPCGLCLTAARLEGMAKALPTPPQAREDLAEAAREVLLHAYQPKPARGWAPKMEAALQKLSAALGEAGA